MFSNKRVSILCNVLLILLFSCTEHQQFPEKDIVMNGGADKSNYYENMQGYTQAIYEKIASSDTAGCTAPPLCISSYQTVLATRNSSVIKATAYKTEWKAKLDDSAFVSGGMFCDEKQNIYACATNGIIYSFDVNGKRRWKTEIPKRKKNIIWEDIIPAHTGILCTSHDGNVYYIEGSNGKISTVYSTHLTIAGAPIVNDEGDIIIATMAMGEAADSVICFNTQMKKKWGIVLPNFRITASPILVNNEIIIGGMRKEIDAELPLVQMISNSGKVLRSFSPDATPRYISGNKSGDIYTVNYNMGMGEPMSIAQCFAQNGTKKWQMSFRFAITSALMVGNNFSCFIAQRGNAIGCYVLDNTGKLIRLIQLDEAPSLLLRSVVNPAGVITLAPLKGGILTKVTAGRSSLFTM